MAKHRFSSLSFIVYSLLIVAGVLLPSIRVLTVHAASGLSIDGSVSTHQTSASSSITSGTFSTTQSNDLLEAFLTSDTTKKTISYSSVTGGGLTWSLRERTNAQLGTAEIWQAVAPKPLTNVTVKAVRSSGSYIGSINVVAFSGADTHTNGAVAGNSASSGAPSLNLTTTQTGSWVWAVGDDWDSPISRTVGSGQTLFDQDLSSTGDTYWVQSLNPTGAAAGTTVTINDTAPTTDRWDLSAIEIRPLVVDTTPPSTPTNLTATANSASQVALSWSASTDNVGVVGYQILRNGVEVATSTTTSYTDNSVSPATSYTYTVVAYDGAGNVSGQSNTATVTTPAATTGGGTGTTTGCSTNGVAAPCIGSTTTGASGWGTPSFDSEFTGTSVNTSQWTVEGPVEPNNTQEYDCYSPTNVSEGGGSVSLKLTNTKCTIGKSSWPDTGAQMDTSSQFNQTYGYYEARVNMPGNGSTVDNWGGFWLTNNNWPNDGEIDVVEGFHGTAGYHFEYAPNGSAIWQGGQASGNWTGWHTYGVNWQANSVTFYYDGKEMGFYTTGASYNNKPMFILLDYSTGPQNNVGGPSVVPDTMQVQYVKAWK